MYTIEDLDKFNRVTKVIVDTNAYYKVGFDFLLGRCKGQGLY